MAGQVRPSLGSLAVETHSWSGFSLTGLSGRRCLVLGGGGFIGTALSERLSGVGAEVSVFTRTRPACAQANSPKWIGGDIADPAAVEQALQGRDIVFHLVSGTIPGVARQDVRAEFELNVLPTLNLLEACSRAKVKKLVFVSSGGAVYGAPETLPIAETAPTRPISAYGVGKVAIEHALEIQRREHDLEYQVLRVSNPYGPGQSPFRGQGVVAALLDRSLRGLPLEIWGDGEIVRDFVFIDDLVEALVGASVYEGPHRIFNVGSGEGRSINEVADDVEKVTGRASGRHRRSGRRADVPVNVLDISRIFQAFGWRPKTDWTEGLAKTARWLEASSKAA